MAGPTGGGPQINYKIGVLPKGNPLADMMQKVQATSAVKAKVRRVQIARDFVAEGAISAQAGERLAAFVQDYEGQGGPGGSVFNAAAKEGIIDDKTAGDMNTRDMEMSHSENVLSGGGALYSYSTGEAAFENETLETHADDEHIIKATGDAVVRLKGVTLNKFGDTTDNAESSLAGLNAAVLTENGGAVYLEDCTVRSDGVGANNVFAHGKGAQIHLSNCLIDAHGMTSNRGIYCSFGGLVTAENCEINSRGFTSAAVATDTGRGSIYLKNTTCRTLGRASACIYSTGDIHIEDCHVNAPDAEALIIVGRNSIHIKNSSVFGAYNQGIKIYSPEGGEGYFEMEGGSFTAAEGPLLYSSDNNGRFVLKNVAVAAPSGIAFQADMRQKMPFPGPPKTEPSYFIADLYDQFIKGDALADKDHSLELNIHAGSEYFGAVNKDRQAANVIISVDSGARWLVTGDSYVDVLKIEDGAYVNGSFNLYYDAQNPENAALGGRTVDMHAGGMILPINN